MRKPLALVAVLALAFALTPGGVATAVTAGQPLVFHEITPCAVFDTRPSQGGTGIMAAGETRTFHVVGSTSNFAGQGGVAGGCGIPGFAGGQPQTQMVYLNLVAVDPVTGGNLKVWATTDPEPAGGVVNYQKLTPNLNNSNSVVVGVRQDTEGNDIAVKANVGSVHVRGVALGYLTTASNSFWSLSGNAGTDPATHFIGTTDNVALNFRVNDARALRLEPNATSPNVIGGFSGNTVTGGLAGATISGGGESGSLNQVGGDFGTVGGGEGNSANGTWATMGGGLGNSANGSSATVGGGFANSASGPHSTVPGGDNNSAAAGNTLAAGKRAKANHLGAFVWADSTNADFVSSAQNEFAVRAGGGVRFVVGANTCTLDTATGAWTGSCAPAGAAAAWELGGNAGTTAGTDFLGTTDDEPLEVKVNGARALRLEPASTPNLIGGLSTNTVTAGVFGATIGGGGNALGLQNRVTDNLGTVGGGQGNRAGNNDATIDNAQYAIVAGGQNNTASGPVSTVGGGGTNSASATLATVGGGGGNTASGIYATIPGGYINLAAGDYSFASGRLSKISADHDGTFLFADSTEADFNSAAANEFAVRAGGGVRFVVGGNTCSLDTGTGAWTGSCAPGVAPQAWLLGGNAGTTPGTDFVGTTDNTAVEFKVNGSRALRLEPHGTSPNVIGGFPGNTVTADVFGATIGGGGAALGTQNRVTDNHGTVGGGKSNRAGDAAGSISDREYATVGGGQFNTASGQVSTVGGGGTNTAGATLATVGGGGGNTASGIYATIPGGYINLAAGDYSFASGRLSKISADHDGTFLFADSTEADFNSAAANEFAVRASGGFRLRTSSDLSTGCDLPAGSGTFVCTSDRAQKEGFRSVSGTQILEGVASLPLSTWRFKGQDPPVRHLGPTAQDFRAAFGLGEDDATISMVDADGVALAAIQGLNEKVEQKDARLAELESRLASVEGGRPTSGGLPPTAMWGLAAALGLVGLGIGRRWGRSAAPAM